MMSIQEKFSQFLHPGHSEIVTFYTGHHKGVFKRKCTVFKFIVFYPTPSQNSQYSGQERERVGRELVLVE